MERQVNGRQLLTRQTRPPPNDFLSNQQQTTPSIKQPPAQEMAYQDGLHPKQTIALIILGLLHIFIGVAVIILHICMIAEVTAWAVLMKNRLVTVHSPLWCGSWFILVGSFGISTAPCCQPDPVATKACMKHLFLVLSAVTTAFALILAGVNFAAAGTMDPTKGSLQLGLSVTIGALGIVEVIICIISTLWARPKTRPGGTGVIPGGYVQCQEQPRAYVTPAQLQISPEQQRTFVTVTPATTPRAEPRQDHPNFRHHQRQKHQKPQQQHHHHHQLHHHQQQELQQHHQQQQHLQQQQQQFQDQQHMTVISPDNLYPGVYTPQTPAKYQVYTFPRVNVAPSRPLPGMWMES
ncbi:uncharacterized protein LOC106163348 [Lingula anatina]|uniref:Uncharacterized protein LOC106163348 n=1 Tax=Lingula anatina TaxID=7574 RepID=A0A1S3IDM0_LINAN|nr:uncharacterized protein LOC106163348 [Lingula anatina]|eukprot:XP_013396360.1 uncharacterized protein LOC106163348 [Lingula anatina]